MDTKESNSGKLLCIKDIMAKLKVSRTALYGFIQWPDFPPPIRLSARTIRWREADIDEWLIARQKP